MQKRCYGVKWNQPTARLFILHQSKACLDVVYSSVSQPPGRGPVPGTGINYTGPREVLWWKYSEEKNIRECVEKLRPRCWPEETTICYKISLVQ